MSSSSQSDTCGTHTDACACSVRRPTTGTRSASSARPSSLTSRTMSAARSTCSSTQPATASSTCSQARRAACVVRSSTVGHARKCLCCGAWRSMHGRFAATARVDDKVRHAIASGWLYAPSLKHETFQLLKTALPAASSDVVDAVVDAASAGRQYQPGGAPTTRSSTFCHGSRRCVPERRIGAGRPRRGHDRAPRLRTADHPDLDSYMETGWVREQLPMTVADFHDIVSRDAGDAVEAVVRYREASSPFDGPTLDDALALVVQTVADHPDGWLSPPRCPSWQTRKPPGPSAERSYEGWGRRPRRPTTGPR